MQNAVDVMTRGGPLPEKRGGRSADSAASVFVPMETEPSASAPECAAPGPLLSSDLLQAPSPPASIVSSAPPSSSQGYSSYLEQPLPSPFRCLAPVMPFVDDHADTSGPA